MSRGSVREGAGLAPIVLPCGAVPGPGLTGKLGGGLRLGTDIRKAAQQRSWLLSPQRQHIAGSLQVTIQELGPSFVKPPQSHFGCAKIALLV